jgi:hypothetical protein
VLALVVGPFLPGYVSFSAASMEAGHPVVHLAQGSSHDQFFVLLPIDPSRYQDFRRMAVAAAAAAVVGKDPFP